MMVKTNAVLNDHKNSLSSINAIREVMTNGLSQRMCIFPLIWIWSVKKLKKKIITARTEKRKNMIISIMLLANFDLRVALRIRTIINKKKTPRSG